MNTLIHPFRQVTCKIISYLICLLVLPFFINDASALVLDSDLYSQPQEQCLTIHVFSDIGCPRCKDAYEFLHKLQIEYPEIQIITKDITFKKNRDELIELSRYHNIDKPGTPSFLICENFLVGFDNSENYGLLIKYLMGLIDELPSRMKSKTIEFPLLGTLSIDKVGLPVLTILIGLVDGFNPCAMWVLLFLLSLLVNLKDRKKIIIISATFILVSGAVYFSFMAAWLNIFLAVGFSRHLQIIVGVIALIIGWINIKDYFSNKNGMTLSIPESVKPSLYQRMRSVLYAQNITAAIVSVTILAVLVNFVELLCTAGLPAIYTQILTLRELPVAKYYAYLLLYNLAYIFDDALMVSIVVYTLSRKKLREHQGRILKLASGLVISALGIILLLKPNWL